MTDSAVIILRIGHRPERDKRVTTHVALASRALGADGMYLAAEDKSIVRTVEDVVQRWGGNFFCNDGIPWKACIRDWKKNGGVVVHLTMYGLPLGDVIDSIRAHQKILVTVGAEKVPGELFGLSDYNLSVTSQPHSEISSLALFLDRLFNGKELNTEFSKASIKVIPSEQGKKTVE